MAEKQRAKGTGQLLKRSYGYLARVYIGQENGRNKYLNQKVRGNKTEAQKVLNKLLGKRDGGELVHDTRTSLNEWLDKWLALKEGSVRGSTHKGYETLLRLYVREPLGEKRLLQLTRPQVQAVYDSMKQKGLSPSTVKHTHAALRAALNDAIEDGLLIRNPAAKVTLPLRQEHKPLRALSQEQVDSFLSVAEESRWYPLYVLLLFTGMRPSEALALKWRDIDWMRRKVSITKMLCTTGTGWKFQDPKSKESRREVSIGQITAQVLLEHQERQRAAVANTHGLVFIGETGEPVDRHNILRREFRPLLKKAGLSESVRLYDLRHTYATLRLLNNDNVKFVSAALGHANIKLTLETYQHYLPGMDDGANDRVEERFYRRESEQLRAVN
jgi:integrase